MQSPHPRERDFSNVIHWLAYFLPNFKGSSSKTLGELSSFMNVSAMIKEKRVTVARQVDSWSILSRGGPNGKARPSEE